ncbi:MAG: nucleotidyl transferase AbiEii/AbiGii toxin family protein [Pyrinomonadaceae bacterium]
MINETLRHLTESLDKNEIDYAVIGAVALNNHGYRRFTEDIDLLLTKEGLEKFNKTLVGLGYRPAFPGATRKFRTANENVPIEIITSGEFPGDGLPKAVMFPNPLEFVVVIDGVNTISLEKLVELKLTSGMTAGDRLKDLADVQELIKLKGLDAEFASVLDEYVREKYLEIYDAVANATHFFEE